jgi:outer membrane porin, OprD family
MALAVAAGTAMSAAAQGIYPRDLSTDGYRLPGGFEPVVHLRTVYFNETKDPEQQTSWALGGWAGLRSPWLGDVVQAAVNGYISQKLYGPRGEGGGSVLQPNQDSIYVLGEAFLAFRLEGQILSVYRQLVNRPFINPKDSRMLPNTFESYMLSGKVDDVSYVGGYITKEKLRDSESFVWMSNVAGGTGKQEGVAFVGATWAFAKGGYVRVDEQYAFDVFNTIYTDVRFPIAIDDETRVVLGAQYYPQSSVGGEQIGSFSTWGYGLQGAFGYGPFGAQLYWVQTGTGRDTLYPFGTHPSYLNLMISTFNTAGEKTWGIGGNVSFAELGAPGLTASVIYASGRDRIKFKSGRPSPDESETDVRVDYAFAKGSPLEGLSATFRYGWLHKDGAQQTDTQLRAIVNYEVKF